MKIKDIQGGHQLPADIAAVAGGSDGEQVVAVAPFRCVVTAVSYVPAAAITGHASNNFDLQLRNRGSDGTGTADVANLEFLAGVNGTAFEASALTVDTANDELAEGDVLSLEKVEGGTGLAMPAGKLVITVQAR